MISFLLILKPKLYSPGVIYHGVASVEITHLSAGFFSYPRICCDGVPANKKRMGSINQTLLAGKCSSGFSTRISNDFAGLGNIYNQKIKLL